MCHHQWGLKDQEATLVWKEHLFFQYSVQLFPPFWLLCSPEIDWKCTAKFVHVKLWFVVLSVSIDSCCFLFLLSRNRKIEIENDPVSSQFSVFLILFGWIKFDNELIFFPRIVVGLYTFFYFFIEISQLLLHFFLIKYPIISLLMRTIWLMARCAWWCGSWSFWEGYKHLDARL